MKPETTGVILDLLAISVIAAFPFFAFLACWALAR